LLIDRIQSSNTRSKISKLKIYDIKNNLFLQYNDSSIAVREKIFNKNTLDWLKNVSSAVDVLLFYIAYCHGGDFVFDNKILTLRRLHYTNTSADRISDYEEWLYHLTKMSAKYMNAYLTFLSFLLLLNAKYQINIRKNYFPTLKLRI
jgi:hypothetical protein